MKLSDSATILLSLSLAIILLLVSVVIVNFNISRIFNDASGALFVKANVEVFEMELVNNYYVGLR